MLQEVRKFAILNMAFWKSANRKGDVKGGENRAKDVLRERALQVNPVRLGKTADRAGCLGLYEETGGSSEGSVQRGHHIL